MIQPRLLSLGFAYPPRVLELALCLFAIVSRKIVQPCPRPRVESQGGLEGELAKSGIVPLFCLEKLKPNCKTICVDEMIRMIHFQRNPSFPIQNAKIFPPPAETQSSRSNQIEEP